MNRIKSYSHVWKVDGVLYNLNDLKLPFPLPFTYLKWLVAGIVTVWMFNGVPPLSLIQYPLLKIVLPFVLAWLMSRKQFSGKTAPQFFATQLAYLLRPKITHMGRTIKPTQTHRVQSDITLVRKVKVHHASN